MTCGSGETLCEWEFDGAGGLGLSSNSSSCECDWSSIYGEEDEDFESDDWFNDQKWRGCITTVKAGAFPKSIFTSGLEDL